MSKSADLEVFLEKLQEKYIKLDYRDAWAYEKPRLQEVFDKFSTQYGGIYHLVEPIALGGSGIAVKAKFIHLNGELQVLKFPRPDTTGADDLNSRLAKERDLLRSLRHPNVIRIVFQGEIATEIPTAFYAMEHLENVKDADDYIRSIANRHELTAALVKIALGAVEGLCLIHEKGQVHLDLKPGNLFVDGSGRAVVADFGFAKTLTVAGMTDKIGGTIGYMHPQYAELMTVRDDKNRNEGGPYARERLKPVFDLFSLGRTFTELISIANHRDPGGAGDYERQYLSLLAYRMLDGNIPESDPLPRHIHRQIFESTKYSSIAEVKEAMDKLVGTHNMSFSVPEIAHHPHHMIQATSGGPVSFTRRVQKVVDAVEVRTLHNLKQLGLVQLVYPTATHSRLEHTLGTYAMTCRYVRSLYNDPINPLFKQLVNDRDIEALILAALVHDIGHYPLAHDLEEANIEVFSHEARSLALLHDPKSDINQVINSSSNGKSDETRQSEWNVGISEVSDIVDRSNDRIKPALLRRCIDGPIDADKADYLVRDSENLRLTYGHGIDLEKLISSVTVISEVSLNRPSLKIGIHERGRIAAESLAFARYTMYGSVYWHHAHRSAKAMLMTLAFEALYTYDQSDRASKKGYEKQLKIALYEYLGRSSSIQQAEMILGEHEHDLQPGSLSIDLATYGMIEWLNQKGGRRANHVAIALAKRQLYKRALVVSRSRDSALNWDLVTSVYGQLGKRWRTRKRINQILEKFVLDTLLGVQEHNRPPSISDEALGKAVAALNRGQSVIVDFPPHKSATNIGGLEIVSERSGGSLDLAHVDEEVEQSRLWSVLNDETWHSNAKLRVFCHGDILGPLTASIQRRDFEKAVDDAIAKAWRDTQSP
ncbi:protein kinase domain-containing protein [Mycobacteroides abscessus]|uniref:protein kinase domain-containing protein n=1 Tax=Mycobacteroides abscessus TaxID=36809 RepID=UPI00038C9190|nr:protein kinase [Mycobacteroides abscessus]EPZ18137.1 hypothetical protein M879_22800 [Mycobacteroides abscessus V06705]MBN7548389.1 HD domain-containing protein [Mycobacteroides abscessus subsp. abscessus]MDM2692287.1 protein kinase [Mycobacteroides abscessus]MDM2697099.1 protein kinase [Mycobacteroides abscessus]MDM2702177.1 protein kinase [Mycobacteroides abscessus]